MEKNLRMHGLLQAYSRTNRILNSIKDCGNSVCLRNLEEATNASLALFSNTGAKGIAITRVLPPMSIWGGKVNRELKKSVVLDKLAPFFH